MSTERVVTEVIASIVVVAGFLHLAVNSDVAAQQSDLGSQINAVFSDNAEVAIAYGTYGIKVVFNSYVCAAYNKIVRVFLKISFNFLSFLFIIFLLLCYFPVFSFTVMWIHVIWCKHIDWLIMSAFLCQKWDANARYNRVVSYS